MIEEKGNSKHVKHDKELLNAFCKVSFSDCNLATKNFLTLLDLPKDLLNHLFDCKVVIDYSDEVDINDMVSYYESDKKGNNAICVLGDYIDNIITNIDKNPEVSPEDMKELSITLMHELIHLNRDVLIEDKESMLSDLDDLLSYRLSQGENGKIILLNALEEGNNYRVNIFNQKHNRYETYLFDKNSFNYKNLDIQIKLNKLFKGLKPIRVFDVKDEEYIVDNPNKDNFDFEEVLTELFARLIIYHNHKYKLDINEFCDNLSKKNIPDDLRNACELLRNMSIDDIKWFLLSCYEDEYTDRTLELMEKSKSLKLTLK